MTATPGLLAAQQRALLQALLLPAHHDASNNIANYAMDAWARGLKVYQSNGHALAQRALGSAYPVVSQLLGDDSFAALAQAFWHAHPPQRGDVAQWGGALPAFLQASAQLADEPYLPDVARVEWLLHGSATAPDAAMDLPSLRLLTEADPAQIALRLSPGTAVVCSTHPVASIVLAHTTGAPTLEEAGRRLAHGWPENTLVWRQGFKPCVREALAGEAELVAALLAGASLADALAQALDATPALDFGAWLTLAAQTGLLIQAIALPPTCHP